jgi:hypothetical protein
LKQNLVEGYAWLCKKIKKVLTLPYPIKMTKIYNICQDSMPKINKHKKQISIVFIESISKMQVKK